MKKAIEESERADKERKRQEEEEEAMMKQVIE
jgi:hypothetical protein